ncbi:tRNA lysidine(34) synthetase TilS [Tianweitania sp. BSSL-BM11]|uniref:tRNA(Ile)-lysidine synthase n=1 Tax=Tianweitania aestuarii TaxID=2814886 RepID=A0ABS5S238_9HYPH|nr:tRNA lysidine(34) synthetase TilS [Tianweitania aestuarii]MBS9722564.1 tRNA lysidine(34) synthetase TilS [Tianweitania aestuarii]
MLNPTFASGSDLAPERLFGELGLFQRRSVLVAVSGGSDSLSLLTLLRSWFHEHGRRDALVAVTVDHRLRAEATDEARAVAAFCAERAIPHITKVWTGEKPQTGLAAAARAARYRLLIETAREIGTDVVLTGHTADDQAETVAMRAERSTGIGLAGMAAETLLDGSIWLLRPLLPVSRAALRAHLQGEGVSWIDDPSNSNPRSERVRVRAALTPDDRMRLVEQAGQAGAARRALAEEAAGLLVEHCAATDEAVMIAPGFFQAVDHDAAIHAFRLLLGVLGRQPHWPDLPRATLMFEQMSQPGFSGSLSGCVGRHRRAGISLRPERRGTGDHGTITTMFAHRVLRPIVPGFDLAAMRALAKILKAQDLPASPSSQHNAPFP